MDADNDIRTLTEHQYSYFARWQAQAVGLDDRTLRRRCENGEYEPVSRRVFRICGAPASSFGPVMVGLLDGGPDAVLSHPTAVRWWGIPGFDLSPVHVSQLRTGARHRN